MARHTLACVLALVALNSAKEQTRWSRQISSYTADISDWVPLPGPAPIEAPQFTQIKRQAVAEPRILAEPVFPGFQRPTGFQDFPSRNYYNSPANRQLYLQSVPAVPSAPQNYLNDQGFSQGIRFGLSQPNFPLNQGFVGPQFTFDSIPQKPRPVNPLISNPVAFPKSNLPSPQAKPFINTAPKKIETPKFVDGYRVENVSNFAFQKQPQSLQKLKYESYDKIPKTEMVPPKSKSEREEVQLLYVPLESLNRGNYNFRGSQLLSDTFNQNAPRPALTNPVPPKQAPAVDFQRPLTQNIDNFNQGYFSSFNSQYKDIDQVPKFSTISTPFPTSLSTTPKPKKLKPHQPPLAIFMTQEAKKGNQVKVGDVLSSLKNADSIAVLDSVNPLTAPKVFIGPSNLSPPENYVRFELPYLSNIDHTEKKLRQLPFFVAPLSYNTPQGFAKIPFPSPHVGSVVINSQIRESPTRELLPNADVIPNSYSTSPQTYKQQEQKPATHTQKPNVSYFTTSAPKTNAPFAHQSNYYSIEPQTVSTIRTPPKEPQASVTTPPKTGSYFLSDINDRYNAQVPNIDVRDSFRPQEPVQAFNIPKLTEPTTQRTTTVSSTPKPSTYPSQLLETHNPYSINQAFHFSTPLDYHNLFDENYATPGVHQPSPPPPPTVSSPSSTSNTTPRQTESVTEKVYQQSSPNYLQNYSPEIHYESEVTNQRYPVPTANDYSIKPEVTTDYSQSNQENTDGSISAQAQYNTQTQYNGNVNTNVEPQSAIENTETVNNAPIEPDTTTKSPYYYNQYETNFNNEEDLQSSPTTSTTTTTTRRPPLRNRGRPRYTTPKADSVESTTRTVVTRRPLRERRPLPPRPRYEPNKITTERATRKPVDSSESTTKYSRGRTRGRVHYKPSESDDYNGKSKHSSKESDLAYQRDVLHQNYPVTLMERSSTVDIEAITEPLPRISSTKVLETATDVYDTENAYSNDRAAISQHSPKEESYSQNVETQTESYVSQYGSREDYTYQSRSSLAPVDAVSNYEASAEKEGDYSRQTTPSLKSESPEVYSYATESSSAVTEQSLSSYSISDLSSKPEEIETTPQAEITKVTKEISEEEPENNVVQTTPSFSRVRVRPGVVRQYHQASSTESSRTKSERRRPSQPVTYRPAFDRRRTTMRIEEIEADLKTKQVHSRPDQDHRHPVYRPEPTTEPSVTTPYSQDSTNKRGVFRRRRPTYTTTSTETPKEAAVTKRTYEVKNRFRGRRPTDKPTTDKSDSTEASTTTVRSTVYNRYTRPSSRLSERFNKKPDQDTEDQDSNFSINRPKYVEPETDQWSPKISTDSFKPYNPNDIVEERKTTPAHEDEELDIITVKNNEYEDILISVTPATNNRVTKKIPDIPPTLEALVEQSRETTKGESGDAMSTFETMLEEVMKNLEEQDKDEYMSYVMKHKGGEIGEIPPEQIITSGDNYKSTTVEDQPATTVEPTVDDSTQKEDEKESKQRRRGFWKKVKVRPVTESIEVAESQYYTNTVNRLGNTVDSKAGKLHEKTSQNDKSKVTTYKPPFQFFKEIFSDADEEDILPTVDIPKIIKENKTESVKEVTEASLSKETPTEANANPGDMDLGTGSPDPTLDDLYSTTVETTTKSIERNDGFSIMDYLFGITSEDEKVESTKATKDATQKDEEIQITTEVSKPRLPTTETSYIPDEITTASPEDETEVSFAEYGGKKVLQESSKVVETTEKSVQIETSSVSSYMDPSNVVSTSMSTEVSHETEICFRGKCIKANKDILL